MNILLHGFGMFPIVFEQLVQKFPQENWLIVLNQPNYYDRFVDLLGAENVLLLEHMFKEPNDRADLLLKYGDSFHADIASEKRPFLFRKARHVENYSLNLYDQMHRFIVSNKIDRVFISQVEGLDGKALIAAANSLGICVRVPISCRNLGGTVICDNDQEWIGLSGKYVDSFKFLDDAYLPVANNKKYLEESMQCSDFPPFWPSLYDRLKIRYKFFLKRNSLFKLDTFRMRALNTFPSIRNLIWSIRKARNSRYIERNACRVDDVRNFIYFPLQYSPESSINTPAPYFVDQLRFIDLVRFNMPAGWVLICKEHPSCLAMRSTRFYREMLSRSGVALVSCDTPSIDLIKSAGLTVSVTGTSVLEAAMLRCPAAAISGIGASVYGEKGLQALVDRVKHAGVSDFDYSAIAGRIGHLKSISLPFELYSPVRKNDPVLSSSNIQELYLGIMQ